ncbi:MAG: CDP-diacylglycerol--glycerol-3-phosphate 3-phosphatidyltransferase [Candidatus Sumerlaeia bacterium]
MNVPNKLTLSRIIVLPFFVILLLFERIGGDGWIIVFTRFLALVLYIGAMVTDIIDGRIARRDNLVTNFGKLFDPLADKLMNCSALVALVELRLIPGWIVIVILAREFIVTGLRSLALMQQRVIAADRWGKNKTSAQVTVIIYGICYLLIRDLLQLQVFPIGERVQAIALTWLLYIYYVTLAVCVAVTVYSGWNYLANNWDLVRNHEHSSAGGPTKTVSSIERS